MKRKYFWGCICIMAMAFSLVACTNGNDIDDGTDDNQTQIEEDDNQTVADVDLEAVYSAYIEILTENKDDIDAYSWQYEVSSDNIAMDRQVSMCDINGDGVPELFFMKANMDEEKLVEGQPYEALLHIYTYEDGEAEEVEYQFGSEDYMDDHHVAAGVRYVVYLGTDGNLHIYYVTGDYRLTSSVISYKSEGDELKKVARIDNVYGPSDDDDDEMIDTYTIDANDVDAAEGKAAFKEAFSKVDEVILFSGYDDSTIWTKFNPDNVESKSCDEMISKLQKGIN